MKLRKELGILLVAFLISSTIPIVTAEKFVPLGIYNVDAGKDKYQIQASIAATDSLGKGGLEFWKLKAYGKNWGDGIRIRIMVSPALSIPPVKVVFEGLNAKTGRTTQVDISSNPKSVLSNFGNLYSAVTGETIPSAVINKMKDLASQNLRKIGIK